MPDPVLEDFTAGQTIVGDPLTVTAEDIVAFARAWDPQPFHVDEEAARGTFVGRLIASGWHTAALGMKLLQAGPFGGGSSLGAPGIDRVRWLQPVLPGDTLRLTFRVEETRVSGSRPDRGFVRCAVSLDNDRGEAAMTQGFSFMLPRRGSPPPGPRRLVEIAEPGPVPEAGPPQAMPFLAEAEIGSVRELGGHAFPADEIVAFARAYDPQAFHVDERAARASHFGGLCASGWHTAAGYMRCLVETRRRDVEHTAARGPAPTLGPSPGFTDLRWIAPVYAGDTVTYRSRLTDKRPSLSRPGWGMAFAHNTGENQRGEPVFSFDSAVFWQWSA